MIVYLLRHGETDYNVTKQYTGTLDIPVSAVGLKQLVRADFDIDHVYVSTLRRTSQTASVLFPNAKLIEIYDLRERHFGSLEGQKYVLSDNDGCFEKAVKDGESKDAFVARTCTAFNKIISQEKANGSNTVVIVAHGGIQMAVLSQAVTPSQPYEKYCAKNGGGFVLEILDDNTTRIISEACYSRV